MNKSELKSFAIFARRELIEKVSLRAKLFGIDHKNGLKMIEEHGQLFVNGQIYPLQMKSAFLALDKELKTKGFEQIIEEVAYTWFNRIIAIRFMEVNCYLPERVNVLSSSTGKVEPDILQQYEMMDLNVDPLEIKKYVSLGEAEKAYRKLFVGQCDALNNILPFLFEKINDYTELLLPDYLLDSESIINKLVKNESLTELFSEVEILGWLYQFYNTEPKDKIFENLKKNKKIEKYDIPAATQLFTPKWIVQYMVENSIGQLWIESNPYTSVKQSMRYYIEPAVQDSEVNKELQKIIYQNVKLEDIKILDPCVGSGHILVYAFDLLYQMYEEAGYLPSDIPKLILEKNLYGLDIDDRATQLASFALMMKARGKSRRIFQLRVKPNVLTIQESNYLDKDAFLKLLAHDESEQCELEAVFNTFENAKNYGSILCPPSVEYDKYLDRLDSINEMQVTLDTYTFYEQLQDFTQLIEQSKVLVNKYDVLITNPPYMGTKGMNSQLSDYLKIHYPDTKSDLSTVFMERSQNFVKNNGFISMINIPSWMFLSSYENLRNKLIENLLFNNLIHLGRGIFGADFGTVAFVFRNSLIEKYVGTFKRLIDRQGEVDTVEKKENKFFESGRINNLNQKEFKVYPSSAIIYWASNKIRDIFRNNSSLYESSISASQNVTGNNKKFLRHFWEINRNNYIDKGGKWRFYAKGGGFKKWFGNLLELVDWSPHAREIYRTGHASQIIPEEFWYKKGITWGLITSSKPSFRVLPKEATFDKGGSTIFIKNDDYYYYVLGFLNSKVGFYLLQLLSPTLNFQVRDVRNLPIIFSNEINRNRINKLVKQCIDFIEFDWNCYETSWGFQRHPFLTYRNQNKTLSVVYETWKNSNLNSIKELTICEEEINQLFIQIYGLENELTAEISSDEISIPKSDQINDVKFFLSYFIGCIMGRFSLDFEGIGYAGGDWDDFNYQIFKPNNYGIILLTDDRYFDNDIIARLREFLAVTLGQESVEENIQWLAESLDLKRNETAEERLRRYFLDEFFKDHLQTYQKRPIYWLVDSGKQKGMRTLIYMHRYQPQTMATIRFEHLQEIQAKYNNEINAIDIRLVNPNLSATEKRELEKKKTMYQKRIEELMEFDKDLATYANAQISIDLDDGVAVNYAKFDKILAPLK